MPTDLWELRFLPGLLAYGGGLAAVFVLGALVFHLYASQAQLEVHNEPAGARVGFLEPTLAVVMLFAVAVSWLRYGDLQNAIQEETGRMVLLGRSALTLPEPDRSRLVYATADYAVAIAEVEWPAMVREGGRAAAADGLQVLAGACAATQPQGPREQGILRQAQRLVRELAEWREARLASARYPLGEAVQAVLAAALGATLLLSWFFGLPNLSIKLVLGGLFAFSLALPLLFNDVLGHPVDGPAALDPQPYLSVARDLRDALAPPPAALPAPP